MISEVSGVGAPPGFHVWSLFANLRARGTGPQVSAGAAYPAFCVRSPGAEGGGAPEAKAAAESSLTSC